MPVPGVTITESSLVQAAPDTQKNNAVLLIGTSSGGTVHTPTKINDLAAFTAAFGTSPSTPYVRALKAYDPLCELWFVKAAAQTAAAFADACVQIRRSPTIPNTFLLGMPEANVALTAQADRNTVFSAAESLAAAWDIQFFWNTAQASNTRALANTEALNYSSPLGHSAVYYGWFTDAGDTIPLSLYALGSATIRARETGFQPPAGVDLPTTITPLNPVDTTEYNDFVIAAVNVALTLPTQLGNRLQIWLARTRSADVRWRYINTRFAANWLIKRCEFLATRFTWQASDPNAALSQGFYSAFINTLEQAKTMGAFSGVEGYRIDFVTLNPGNLQAQALCDFVNTVETVNISILNGAVTVQ